MNFRDGCRVGVSTTPTPLFFCSPERTGDWNQAREFYELERGEISHLLRGIVLVSTPPTPKTDEKKIICNTCLK